MNKSIRNINFIICILSFLHLQGFTQNKESFYKFLENKGQWHKNVIYRIKAGNTNVYLENNRITYDLHDEEALGKYLHQLHDQPNKKDKVSSIIDCHAYRVKFKNANPDPDIESKNQLKGYYNFYQSQDRSKWASKVRSYSKVRYNNLYKGIDLLYHQNTDPKPSLKYDFIVSNKGNPKKIKLEYQGVDDLHIDHKGALIIETNVGAIKELKPYAYQINEKNKK
ncbi:MAG: hypothetical protein ABEH43_05025 [Flavobacteriales bacterium]